jgi:hypothetical protein
MKRVKINEELLEVSSHDELSQQIKDYAKRRGIETFFVEADGRNIKPDELKTIPLEEIRVIQIFRYTRGAKSGPLL